LKDTSTTLSNRKKSWESWTFLGWGANLSRLSEGSHESASEGTASQEEGETPIHLKAIYYPSCIKIGARRGGRTVRCLRAGEEKPPALAVPIFQFQREKEKRHQCEKGVVGRGGQNFGDEELGASLRRENTNSKRSP